MKTNVVGEIWGAITYILGMVITVAFMTVFLGMLFAPCFEDFVARDLKVRLAEATTLDEVLMGRRQLALARLALWLSAIFAWSLLLVTNAVYWRVI